MTDKTNLKLELSGFRWVGKKTLQLTVTLVLYTPQLDDKVRKIGIAMKHCIVYRDIKTLKIKFRPPGSSVGKSMYNNIMVTKDLADMVISTLEKYKPALVESIGSNLIVDQSLFPPIEEGNVIVDERPEDTQTEGTGFEA